VGSQGRRAQHLLRGEPLVAFDNDAVHRGRWRCLFLRSGDHRPAENYRQDGEQGNSKPHQSLGVRRRRRPQKRAASELLCLGAGAGQGAEDESVSFRREIHFDLIAPAELAHQYAFAQRILDVTLDGPLERPGAVALVVPLFD